MPLVLPLGAADAATEDDVRVLLPRAFEIGNLIKHYLNEGKTYIHRSILAKNTALQFYRSVANASTTMFLATMAENLPFADPDESDKAFRYREAARRI